MHNATSFATSARMATESVLDAMSSTDSTRSALLRDAGRWLDKAAQQGDTADEVALVDALGKVVATMASQEG